MTGRLRFLRILLGRARRRHRRARRAASRSSAATSRRTIRRRPIGVPLSGASSDALARHRLPRPRRPEPPALRRPLGDRARARAATLLAYAVGLAIGLIAGYSRSLRRPAADALGRRPARVPAAALPARPDHRRRHGRRRARHRRRDRSRRRRSAASSARRRRSRPCAATSRPPSRAASARSRSSAARCCRTSWRPCSSTSGLRFTFSILIIASVNFLGLGLQPPSSDWALMISENREYISLNVAGAVLAPAAMIALLTIGINLTGDAHRAHRSAARTCRGRPGA